MTDPEHVEEVVASALSTAGAPDARELVLALALRYAHETELPCQGERLKMFITGPLHAAVETCLDPDTANQVVAHMDRGLAAAIAVPNEQPTRSTRRPRHAAPAAQGEAPRPTPPVGRQARSPRGGR